MGNPGSTRTTLPNGRNLLRAEFLTISISSRRVSVKGKLILLREAVPSRNSIRRRSSRSVTLTQNGSS